MNWSNCITKLCLLSKSSYSVKYISCFMLRHFMTPWHLNIWKVKIWLSQEQKELLKWKSQTFYLVSQVFSFTSFQKCSRSPRFTSVLVYLVSQVFSFTLFHKCSRFPRFTSVLIYLVSQVLSFKLTKQASKIIADTTFNSDTNLRDKAKLYNGVHK